MYIGVLREQRIEEKQNGLYGKNEEASCNLPYNLSHGGTAFYCLLYNNAVKFWSTYTKGLFSLLNLYRASLSNHWGCFKPPAESASTVSVVILNVQSQRLFRRQEKANSTSCIKPALLDYTHKTNSQAWHWRKWDSFFFNIVNNVGTVVP